MQGNPVYPGSLFRPPLFLACTKAKANANSSSPIADFLLGRMGCRFKNSCLSRDGSGFIPIPIEPRWTHGMPFDFHDRIP